MPRTAGPSQPSMTSGAPGYQALSPRLGNDGNRPLAAQPFAHSFVSHTNNLMMQTQGGGNHSGTIRKVIFERHKGNDYNDLLKSHNVRK